MEWSQRSSRGLILDRTESWQLDRDLENLTCSQGVRGWLVATMSEEETACRWQPGLRHGCQVHAVWSVDAEVVEAVRKSCIWA